MAHLITVCAKVGKSWCKRRNTYRPSPEGSGGVFFPNQGPPIFYCSWVPKGPEKSGGPSQSGSFSATGTIKVRISCFFRTMVHNELSIIAGM